MKYKIIKYQDADKCIIYTLYKAEKEEDGETILVFEVDSEDHANFIKNQFLHLDPYKPFDNCWMAKIRHVVSIDNKIVIQRPYGTIKCQWGFSYIMTKKYKKRAEADLGFIFIAYNLRRILNILDRNTLKAYLKIVISCFFSNNYRYKN